jgi:hypothetical protein
VSFAAITLCVASQRVFIVVVISLSTQSGNLWIHLRRLRNILYFCAYMKFLTYYEAPVIPLRSVSNFCSNVRAALVFSNV